MKQKCEDIGYEGLVMTCLFVWPTGFGSTCDQKAFIRK